LYSEDQTAIRIQNCVISCECLLIGLFQFQHFILLCHANIYIVLHYTVHDHSLLVNIYTRVVRFGTEYIRYIVDWIFGVSGSVLIHRPTNGFYWDKALLEILRVDLLE